MKRKQGGRRSLMQRAADAQRIVKVIIKSLDYEPVSVSRLAEEFGIDRRQIRNDISLWLEHYGDEDPDTTNALLNWRDSHVANKKVRDNYIGLAIRMMDERSYDLKAVAEIIGVDYQSLAYWMRRAGVKPSTDQRTRAESRFASAVGDVTLSEHLERMRLQMIVDARKHFRDEIAEAEAEAV